jgi:hypothetical protein
LCVAQSVVAIRAVSAGLGVVPEDLSDAAQENAEKVRRNLTLPNFTGHEGSPTHRLCLQRRSSSLSSST